MHGKLLHWPHEPLALPCREIFYIIIIIIFIIIIIIIIIIINYYISCLTSLDSSNLKQQVYAKENLCLLTRASGNLLLQRHNISSRISSEGSNFRE